MRVHNGGEFFSQNEASCRHSPPLFICGHNYFLLFRDCNLEKTLTTETKQNKNLRDRSWRQTCEHDVNQNKYDKLKRDKDMPLFTNTSPQRTIQ